MAEKEALTLANRCATMSCPKWNKSSWQPKTKVGKLFKSVAVDKIYQFSRQYYRKKYWEMSEAAWRAGEHRVWMNILKRNHNICINTYPWPYSAKRFANWTENTSPENCSLVFDPSGFVVKHARSYCAWKIREFTGKWPKAGCDMTKIEPKNWQYYLSLLGYKEVVLIPEPNHHYVGIDPLFGEHGLVFWYEKKTVKGGALVSTYRNKEFTFWIIREEKIPYNIWIRID